MLTHAVLPSAADRVLISVNPKAGAGAPASRVEELAARLRDRKLQVDVHSDLDIIGDLANSLHSAGKLRAVVGVGGDCTAAELLNRTAPGVPLALFPQCTENLLARHFGITASPAEV